MTEKITEYYIVGFLNIDAQTEIILKSKKLGKSVSFSEYGAGTFVTVMDK